MYRMFRIVQQYCCPMAKTVQISFIQDNNNVPLPSILLTEEALVPYSKPSFPSPGGLSSSGTASSKGSTGPRKGEVIRGSHQRNTSDLIDVGYIGSNSQGQFSGDLCKISF